MQTGLTLIAASQQTADKIREALKGSAFYCEYQPGERSLFFPEVIACYDELERLLEAELAPLNFSYYLEGV